MSATEQTPQQKLETLPPELEARLPARRGKWIGIGLSTTPTNRERAWDAMRGAYRNAGLTEPTHQVWTRSPFEAALAWGYMAERGLPAGPITDAMATVGRGTLKRWAATHAGAFVGVGGLMDVGWLSFYDALQDYCEYRLLAPLNAVAEEVSVAYTFQDMVIFAEKMTACHRDPAGRLHHESDMAVRFGDGYGLWRWHGTPVPSWIITHPEQITVAHIRDAENVEIRRVLTERFGFDRYVDAIGARPVDVSDYGKLYRVPQTDDEDLVFVRVVNSTPEPGTGRDTGITAVYREYTIRVPPTMERARDAVAWTFGLTGDEYLPGVES